MSKAPGQTAGRRRVKTRKGKTMSGSHTGGGGQCVQRRELSGLGTGRRVSTKKKIKKHDMAPLEGPKSKLAKTSRNGGGVKNDEHTDRLT